MTPEALEQALEERALGRQADAATALRTTQGTISRWLSGVRPIPPVIELALMAIPTAHGRAKSSASRNGNRNRRARKSQAR